MTEQTKQAVVQKKGAKYATWKAGTPVERKLPSIDKNAKWIHCQHLGMKWIKTQLEDELKLHVYNPNEDSPDGAVIDIEDRLLGCTIDPTIDPTLQNGPSSEGLEFQQLESA